MAEASEHNTKEDCWVVIDGKVYDVSSYMDDHTGGDDVMLKVTGKDATDDFEDAGHTKSARELMEKFFIGELDPSAPAIPKPETVSKQPSNTSQKVMDLAKHYWVLPVAIVGVSVAAGFLFLRKK
nr:cytochrome B5 [Ipomoea batatas]